METETTQQEKHELSTWPEHWMAELNQSGDTKVTWNPSNNDEVEAARLQFDRLKEKGFTPFSVDPKDGSKDEQIKKFNPDLKAVIMIPPMKGG